MLRYPDAKIPHLVSLVDLLRWRTESQNHETAFIFMEDEGSSEQSLTYAQLDRKARIIAARLQADGLQGERAMLLYPPGLDYIAAFFGCLYAGVIAVPAYPPRLNRPIPRLQSIFLDAQSTTVLTDSFILGKVEQRLEQMPVLAMLKWIASDALTDDLADRWRPSAIGRDDLAFLQYTSGSTAKPKGVMVSHGNLLSNLALIYNAFSLSPESRGVSWLPPYHDMGLIGGILQPLYIGVPMALMSPIAFLQRPLRWLEAIDRFRASINGGPNFGYDLCVQKTTPEQRAALDLSCWEVAFNGAEPIRADTLRRFNEAFAPAGFRPKAFYPCYGLAEATLIVSGGEAAALPVTRRFESEALAQDKAVAAENGQAAAELVSCGHTLPGQEIVVVIPESGLECEPGTVGEIWVSGPSIALGYWQNPAGTAETFQARLAGDEGRGPFLRTGDLGFLLDGELFVTGRLKDLIIIRGRNHYPQDIEHTVVNSHDALRPGCTAAFTVDADGEEKLVVVQELRRRVQNKVDTAEVAAVIRQAVAEAHELQIETVVLLAAGGIPKTSSGKVQRALCRKMLERGELEVVGQLAVISERLAVKSGELAVDSGRGSFIFRAVTAVSDVASRRALLEVYLQEQVAEVLQVSPEVLGLERPLTAVGLDSLRSVELKHKVETELNIGLSLADLLDGMTVSQLAQDIAERVGTEQSEADPLRADPLRPVARQEGMPLSFNQERLWFIDRLTGGQDAYNLPVALRLTGELNHEALAQSLTALIARHEILRTTFEMLDGRPVQRIHPPFPADIAVLDESPAVQAQITDLSQLPLLNAQLVRLDEREHLLLFNIHHIIADGWSMAVILREIQSLYAAYAAGEKPELPELPLQYADFAHWQRESGPGDTATAVEHYWRGRLAGAPPLLKLPTDRPRPATASFKGGDYHFTLDAELLTALDRLGQSEQATRFMVFMAGFKLLLGAMSGRSDIVVGTSTANRTTAELNHLIGLFVNELVLRTDLGGSLSFRDALHQVRQTVLEAFAHQEMPFNRLVELLNPPRHPAYNPLFQVTLVYENVPLPPLELAGLSLELLDSENVTAPFDISLLLSPRGDMVRGTFRYNSDLFDEATIGRMAVWYQALLKAIAAQPEARTADLLNQSRPPVERTGSYGSTITVPADQCLHHLFSQQAHQTPERAAVIFGDDQLSYGELNRRANQLAHFLQSQGVRPERRVGIYLNRSVEMAAAIMGILKAGGAYVPLDPLFPPQRLALIMEEAALAVVVTNDALAATLPNWQGPILRLDADWDSHLAMQPTADPAVPISPDNLAYVLYTSGSTGRPKGVMVQHASAANLRAALNDAVYDQYAAPLRLSINAPIVFDGSVKQWIQLTNGHTLFLVPEDARADAAKMLAFIEEQRLDGLDCTPALLRRLMAAGLAEQANLKTVLIGGEAIDAALWEQLAAQPQINFVNVYGPTEGTVNAAVCPIQASPEQPAIGQAIANTAVHLLDNGLNAVDGRTAGEIYLGGAGLARGYLNRPALTAELFLPNPFSDRPGGRLYCTGDRAAWLPDGLIEFLGRADDQVQLQGIRIEPGEIEAALLGHEAVEDAVVIMTGSAENAALATYFVSSSNGFNPAAELRQHLRRHLPEYMIPRYFVPLVRLPLTPTGKVDRKALPDPVQAALEITTIYTAPRNEIERRLVNIWQGVLDLEQVGIHDNFFDLGGTSLLLVQAHDRLQATFDHSVPLVDLYRHPTVSELTRYLQDGRRETAARTEAIQDRIQRQKAAQQRRVRVRSN
jgi:amino acid adenylation domain-containing protein